MSLPGSPFVETLILKHSSTSPSACIKSPPSIQARSSTSHHAGGSLNRHLRRQSGHSKRSSLSKRKRGSWASSLSVAGECHNGGGNSEASSFGQQLSWRSSCGMRKGFGCHPREMLQQSNFTTTQYSHQIRHPYMLSYSPSTYLEAHADRLPYVDDSTAVSPAISELDNCAHFLSNLVSFNQQHQFSIYYCNYHEGYCNQSDLDHNHYHHYHNGGAGTPPCPPIHQHPSPSTHWVSKPSEDSAFSNGRQTGCRSLVTSPTHTVHQSSKPFTNQDYQIRVNQQQGVTPYTCLPHSSGHSSSLEVRRRHSHYFNNDDGLESAASQNESTTKSYDLNIGITKSSEKKRVLLNSVGEVCDCCLIRTSDTQYCNYHHLRTNNHMHAANINTIHRDHNDLNDFGGGFRSRHNSYCSHASRWSYSSHVVDPFQDLRSPSSCLIECSAREGVSRKSSSVPLIEGLSGASREDTKKSTG